MVNGERKLLRDLRPGDRVLSMNSKQEIIEDEVMMMLDSQPNRPGKKDFNSSFVSFFIREIYAFILALFYSIETETGHRLSLTGSHFIAVDQKQSNIFLPAHQIKANHRIFVNHNGQLQSVTVRNISEEYKVGYVTPMTGQGK